MSLLDLFKQHKKLFVSKSYKRNKNKLKGMEGLFFGERHKRWLLYETNSNKYPIVISLHGIKEKGNTLTDVARVASL